MQTALEILNQHIEQYPMTQPLKDVLDDFFEGLESYRWICKVDRLMPQRTDQIDMIEIYDLAEFDIIGISARVWYQFANAEWLWYISEYNSGEYTHVCSDRDLPAAFRKFVDMVC